MEQIETQSAAWRFFAILVGLVLALVAFVSPVLPAPGFNFQGAKMLYWLLAPLGLFGYAYGWRFFGVTFWKFYAVIFTVEIVLRMLRTAAGGGHSAFLVVPVVAVIGLMCIALLRYGEILKPRDDYTASVFR